MGKPKYIKNLSEFKALMHMGQYINANMLEKGVYGTDVPFVYPKDTTIEAIEKMAKGAIDKTGKQIVPESYFKNLKHCELIPITIKIKLNLEL